MPHPHSALALYRIRAMAGLDMADEAQSEDGTHLLPPGQRIWLECMKGVADGLLD